jgi:hypothetical protein
VKADHRTRRRPATRRRITLLRSRAEAVFGYRLAGFHDGPVAGTSAPEELWTAMHRADLFLTVRWLALPAPTVGPPGHAEIFFLVSFRGPRPPPSVADEVSSLLALAFPRYRFEPLGSEAELRFALSPFGTVAWSCTLDASAGARVARPLGFVSQGTTGEDRASAVLAARGGDPGRALLLLSSWRAATFLEWTFVPARPSAREREHLAASVGSAPSDDLLFFKCAVSWQGASGPAPFLLGAPLSRALGAGLAQFRPSRAADSHALLFAHSAMPDVLPSAAALGFIAPALRTFPSRLPEAALPDDGSTLGTTVDHRPVLLPSKDALRGVWVVGATGVGKTTLVEHRVLETIEAGLTGVAVFDPHGDLVDAILRRIPAHRVPDVVTVDVRGDPASQPSFNLLEARTVAEAHRRVGQMVEVVTSRLPLEMRGPAFVQASTNAGLVLSARFEEPGTIADLPRMFLDKRFRDEFLAAPGVAERVPEAVRWWTEGYAHYSDFTRSESMDYYISKYALFSSDPVLRAIVGRRRSTLDFRALMDGGGILLCSLGRAGMSPLATALLTDVFMQAVFNAALSRADQAPEQRRHFHVYCDEFQRIAGPSTGAMLAEIRKYGVGLFLANQYIDQLPDDVLAAMFGNVGSKMYFRLGARDALRLTQFQPSLSVEELVRLPNFTAVAELLADGIPTAPFTLLTPRPVELLDATADRSSGGTT